LLHLIEPNEAALTFSSTSRRRPSTASSACRISSTSLQGCRSKRMKSSSSRTSRSS
jgi:hypothetical protein